jgi:hypothetical protein
VIDEQVAPDARAGVDVDRGEEAGEMIDEPGQKEQPPAEQSMGHPVQAQRPNAGIKQDLGQRPGCGVACADARQIGPQRCRHAAVSSTFVGMI